MNKNGIHVELKVGGLVTPLECPIRLRCFDDRGIVYATIPLTPKEERHLFDMLTMINDAGNLGSESIELKPTPDNISILPKGIRDYIHELEARCDPVGEFQAWKAGEDAVLALATENKELKKRIEELEEKIVAWEGTH